MFAISKIAKASPLLGHLKTKSSSFLPSTALFQFEQVAGFKYEPKRTNKKGLNIHRSNKAKAGLYHGKDKQFGHSISHSHHRSKRSWLPNVQKKRLWSDSLNQWIRFNATTTAIQAVDDIGGIDQYLLNLDEKYVQDSPFITKHRDLIARASYLNGELSPKHVHYFGFDTNPPLPGDIAASEENQKKVVRKSTFKDRRKAIIAKISKFRTGPPHNPLIEEAIRLKKEKRAQQTAIHKV